MYSSLIIVSMALGLGSGMLCWKSTEPWRLAARPGPTEANTKLRNMEALTGFFSIGVGIVGGFVGEYLLLWLG